MRINSIVRESIVDGPGLRYVVFTQGCPHRCEGCHNPQTHDCGGGYEISAGELTADLERTLSDNPLIQGVTLSGGEPFIQADELVVFAEFAHEMGLDVWAYTGYTLEELVSLNDPGIAGLIRLTDVLVDGRFEAGKRTLETRFVGSTNQRVIENPSALVDLH